MPDVKRVGDLEIGEDMRLEKNKWVVERIGWVVMLILLLAALAGLLGKGPLSSAIGGTKGSGLWLEYNRFDRYQRPAQLRIHVGQGLAATGELRLWLSRPYIENIEIQRVDPEPERVELAGERMVFVFPIADPNQPTGITFHYEANKFGSMPARLGVEGGPEAQIKQFIYP